MYIIKRSDRQIYFAANDHLKQEVKYKPPDIGVDNGTIHSGILLLLIFFVHPTNDLKSHTRRPRQLGH